MDIFATIIVPAAQARAARDAAAQFTGGEGMLTAGLSATGTEPATGNVFAIPAESNTSNPASAPPANDP